MIFQNNTSLGMEENQIPTGHRKERKSLRRQRTQNRIKTASSVVVIMTISFYLCWTPYATVSLMSILRVPVTEAPSVLGLLCAKLGVVVNPIIYIFFNKEVKLKKPLL